MANKSFKSVEKCLIGLGYVFDHINAKSQRVYVQAGHADLLVSAGIAEHAARQLITSLQKRHGVFQAPPKRNAAAIKERRATDRSELKARAAKLDIERTDILTKKSKQLNGLGGYLSPKDMGALVKRLEAIEREQAEIHKLMNAPVGGSHQGPRKAQHQTGQRSA